MSRTVSINRLVHTDHEHYILKTHTANSWLLKMTAKNLTVNTERQFLVGSFTVTNKVHKVRTTCPKVSEKGQIKLSMKQVHVRNEINLFFFKIFSGLPVRFFHLLTKIKTITTSIYNNWLHEVEKSESRQSVERKGTGKLF
jgi:hypothetical protein